MMSLLSMYSVHCAQRVTRITSSRYGVCSFPSICCRFYLLCVNFVSLSKAYSFASNQSAIRKRLSDTSLNEVFQLVPHIGLLQPLYSALCGLLCKSPLYV